MIVTYRVSFKGIVTFLTSVASECKQQTTKEVPKAPKQAANLTRLILSDSRVLIAIIRCKCSSPLPPALSLGVVLMSISCCVTVPLIKPSFSALISQLPQTWKRLSIKRGMKFSATARQTACLWINERVAMPTLSYRLRLVTHLPDVSKSPPLFKCS